MLPKGPNNIKLGEKKATVSISVSEVVSKHIIAIKNEIQVLCHYFSVGFLIHLQMCTKQMKQSP